MTSEQPRVMRDGRPNPTGTGRYCAPRVCYCGGCAWYVPLPPIVRLEQPAPAAPEASPRSSWDDREDATWIDAL